MRKLFRAKINALSKKSDKGYTYRKMLTYTYVSNTYLQEYIQNVQPITRGLKQLFLYSSQAGLPA